MAAISEETGLPVRLTRYSPMLRWGIRMVVAVAIAITAALLIDVFTGGMWS